MGRFVVTYPSGVSEVCEQSETDTIEEFINVKFGIPPAEVAAHGVRIESETEVFGAGAAAGATGAPEEDAPSNTDAEQGTGLAEPVSLADAATAEVLPASTPAALAE